MAYDRHNEMKIVGPLTAFGEVRTSQMVPRVQIDAIYGLRTKTDHEVFTDTGGAVVVENTGTGNEFKCSTGTSVGGYGLVRSRRVNRYRPGQGAIYRFTARFDEGVALSRIAAGPVTLGNELSFGYSGADFGLLHRRGGLAELRTMTITTPAGGNETVTITLNSVAFTVDLTTGTAAHNAYEIEADHAANDTFTGWNVSQNGATVVFSATSVGSKAGTYSLASAGATVATFVQDAAGAAVTDDFVNQADWNIDPMDGSGPSAYNIDPQKINVFEIEHAYLGGGDIIYGVYHPNHAQFYEVHKIEFAGKYTTPNSSQPSFKVGWFAASLGSTTDLNVYGSSAMAAVDGCLERLRTADGHANEKTGISTTLTNIMSIRIRDVFNDYTNLSEVVPVFLTGAVDGTKSSVIEILINPTVAGETNWSYHDQTNDSVEIDTAGTTVSTNANTIEITKFELSKSGQLAQDLRLFDIRLHRGDVLTIAARTTSGTTEAGVSLTWFDD